MLFAFPFVFVGILAVGQDPADWPGLLGPRGDLRASPTQKIMVPWPANGLTREWSYPLGEGYAAPVSAMGKVYAFHRIDKNEIVDAIDAATGRKLWSTPWVSTYSDAYGKGDGPRATPLVVKDSIIIHSPDGSLRSLDATTGKVRWVMQLAKDLNANLPFFGAGASPALIDGVLILNCGGSEAGIVGINPLKGQIEWKQTRHPAGYATPVSLGNGLAAVFTRTGLVLLKSADGQLVLEQRWRSRMDASVNAASPVVWERGVVVSSSYATGCLCLEKKGNQWVTAWSNDSSLSCHFSTPVSRDGLLFGFHGRQEQGASLRCVDAATGKVHWEKEGTGIGWIGSTADGLLILCEDGTLSLIKPKSEKYEALATTRLVKGPVWSHAALADGNIYVRDSKSLMAFRLGAPATNR
jgi:outer membrane protein assembly factor BamB